MMIDSASLLMATMLTSILMAMGLIFWMGSRSFAPLIPRTPQLGPRLIWVMMVICLIFWGTVIHFTLDLLTFFLSSPRQRISSTSHVSLSSLPYRAYLLSCCLLD